MLCDRGKKGEPWVDCEIGPQSEKESPENVNGGTKRVWEEARALD